MFKLSNIYTLLAAAVAIWLTSSMLQAEPYYYPWGPPAPGYGYGYPPPVYDPGYRYPRPGYGYRPGYRPPRPYRDPYAPQRRTTPSAGYEQSSDQAQSQAAAKPSATAGKTGATVSISGMQFQPATIRIKAGEAVTWSQADQMPHTVISSNGKDFASGRLNRGGKFQHTFNSPGTYDYFCSIHPSMTGRVVVE